MESRKVVRVVRMDFSALREVRMSLLKSLRIFVDHATIRAREIIRKEEGRAMAAITFSWRKSPPPHSLVWLAGWSRRKGG